MFNTMLKQTAEHDRIMLTNRELGDHWPLDEVFGQYDCLDAPSWIPTGGAERRAGLWWYYGHAHTIRGEKEMLPEHWKD